MYLVDRHQTPDPEDGTSSTWDLSVTTVFYSLSETSVYDNVLLNVDIVSPKTTKLSFYLMTSEINCRRELVHLFGGPFRIVGDTSGLGFWVLSSKVLSSLLRFFRILVRKTGRNNEESTDETTSVNFKRIFGSILNSKRTVRFVQLDLEKDSDSSPLNHL